jgi:hypothetical protein
LKAGYFVAAALILGALGLVTTLVPLAPQALLTPVVMSYTTSYTTMTPYTVRYVQVTDNPHDVKPYGYGDIESVTYERVGDSLRINVTLSQPLHIMGRIVILIYPSPNGGDFRWQIVGRFGSTSDPTYSLCMLYSEMAGRSSDPVIVQCSMIHGNEVSLSILLSAINYPNKIYLTAHLVYSCNENDCPRSIDDVPDLSWPSLASLASGTVAPPVEVDLSPDYARTTTRTFVTYSTHASSYSSAYTATVPLAVSIGAWVPVSILAVAAGLFAAAIYISRKSPEKVPERRKRKRVAHKGPKSRQLTLAHLHFRF